VKLEVLNTSVVVLAQHHNPTILHPSFLVAQKIVPSSWETTEVICTPPFAMVKYENGIVFNVDVTKFQVIDNEVKDVKKSTIAEFAWKYTEKLPHVSYKAIGINFDGFIECSNPESMLISEFLKPDSGRYNKSQPDALGLRLAYMLPNATRLQINCEAAKIRRTESENEHEGVLVKANYHKVLPEKITPDDIKTVIFLFSKRCSHFSRTVKKIFSLGTKK